MGTLFRSQEMQPVQLFVQIEAAHDTVDELGNLGLIEFRDLNADVNAFQRHFVNEVKRADEMQRKLRFFEDQIQKNAKDVENILPHVVVDPASSGSSSGPSLDELESKLEDLEKDLVQMNNNLEMLNRGKNELIELQHVLDKDSTFFTETEVGREVAEEDNVRKPLLSEGPAITRSTTLGFVTGVIPREKKPAFERVLWRATRGNLFMKQAEIENMIIDPHTGEEVEKNVFIIFFQGERAQQKIKKICESFGANLYPCPDNKKERDEILSQVRQRLKDLNVVLERTVDHRRQILGKILAHLAGWREKVIKEKAIYHTMNMFNYDIGRRCLIAEGWCPASAHRKIQEAMDEGTKRSGAHVSSVLSVRKANEVPPTYFATNKFTQVFQDIVDAYGIARYREANPAPFTIITFPFLFAVMFGDLGHGFLMLLVSSILVKYEDKLGKMDLNEMIRTCFNGRYVLLLMSMFSLYTGLIYNECFSVPMDLFGTHWALPDKIVDSNGTVYDNQTAVYHYCVEESNPCEYHNTGGTYLFGVDPVWKGNMNELLYYNSLKMKMSILFGVTQMCFGILLSGVNAIFFRNYLSFFNEFVPQLLFMLSIFGYMCFLIVYKWVALTKDTIPAAPRLLNVLIKMFLSPTTMTDETTVFSGQVPLQPLLLVVALLAVPWMLLVKPLVLRNRHKKDAYKVVVEEDDGHGHAAGGGHGGHDGEEFDFGEVFVHQIIHTIEFVLGAISNTASYLRLWALSLAHSELSTVFWEKILVLTMGYPFPFLFIGFGMWAGCTVGVLLVMESLSAFLHALRLHWVEFQNKFYQGDGRKFKPFAYKTILSGEDDD